MRFPGLGISRDELAKFLFAEEWPDLSESDFERTAPDRFFERADAILANYTLARKADPEAWVNSSGGRNQERWNDVTHPSAAEARSFRAGMSDLR